MAGNVWFTSDLHLGHAKVASIRGFDSPAEHDEALADMWRSTVRKEDSVWVLGDVTGSTAKGVVMRAVNFMAWLPGLKHLVLGNHDAAHPMYRDAHKRNEYHYGFHSVAMAARRRIAGRNVLLSHFPYERDREETRHAQWRLRDEGLWLIHGHTHGTERVTITPPIPGTEFIFAPAREVHVGLDAWGQRLVHLDEIAQLMASAEGVAA